MFLPNEFFKKCNAFHWNSKSSVECVFHSILLASYYCELGLESFTSFLHRLMNSTEDFDALFHVLVCMLMDAPTIQRKQKQKNDLPQFIRKNDTFIHISPTHSAWSMNFPFTFWYENQNYHACENIFSKLYSIAPFNRWYCCYFCLFLSDANASLSIRNFQK